MLPILSVLSIHVKYLCCLVTAVSRALSRSHASCEYRPRIVTNIREFALQDVQYKQLFWESKSVSFLILGLELYVGQIAEEGE